MPVEIFAGNERATLDILFFKFIKNKTAQNTKWLFFNRNRASIDYKMTTTTNLPQFSFTEAISYNDKKLKGFAPVLVAQLLNRGVYGKLGMQYAITGKNYTVFNWVVSELKDHPNIDYFLLTRYTPKLNSKLNLFTQVELLSSIATAQKNKHTFVQRIRLGLKRNLWQFGLGADFSEIGKTNYVHTQNIGAFLRHEF
jgi:hypothetical protein